MRAGKSIEQKRKKKPHGHEQQCGDCWLREGAGEKMAMEGDLTWGGEHTVLCIDDELCNCAPETCVILLTSVTPIYSIKRKKKQFKIRSHPKTWSK